jgi:hypothetical protein
MTAVAALLTLDAQAAASPNPALESQQSGIGEPVIVPFNPPLNQPIRYERTLRTNDRGNAMTEMTTFSVEFEAREGGYRMVYWDNADASLRRERMVPIIIRLSAAGRIEAIENRDAVWNNGFGHVEGNSRSLSEPIRTQSIRNQRAILAAFDFPNAMAAGVMRLFVFADARLISGTASRLPLDFRSEYGTTTADWQVNLETADASKITISAEGSLSREQSADLYEGLTRRYHAAGGDSRSGLFGRSPAAAEHYSERAHIRYVISSHDGLPERVERYETREQRYPGSPTERKITTVTIERRS